MRDGQQFAVVGPQLGLDELPKLDLARPKLPDVRAPADSYVNVFVEVFNDSRTGKLVEAEAGIERVKKMLDGFEAPNSGGRSVASVVDNTLIGIVGNCLVMPVSRGYHLDPTFNQNVEKPIDLLEHYQPNTPIEPVTVSGSAKMRPPAIDTQ